LAAAAAAVVALAVVSMARTLATTVPTRAIAAGAFAVALAVYHFAAQLQFVPLVLGGIAGALAIRSGAALPPQALKLRVSRAAGFASFAALVAGLAVLPLVTAAPVRLFTTFFRAGSLVFGGGHVVLPFLEGLVRDGSVPSAEFFAGYGAAQVVPGPLFTFASFLGTVATSGPGGVPGALIATAGIFLPSFLLLGAAIPLWSAVRSLPRAGAVLAGINASVVGLLAAVFVDPIARTILVSPLAIAIAVTTYLGLTVARLPAWAVVLVCGLLGAAAATAGVH
jgi:chromate transporter